MTLQDIKNEYARGNGYNSFEHLWEECFILGKMGSLDSHSEEIAKRYASACILADREHIANLSQEMRYFIDEPDTDNVDILGMKHRRQQDCYAVPKQTILEKPIELL